MDRLKSKWIVTDNFPLQGAVNFCDQIQTDFVIQINQSVWLTRIIYRSWIRHQYSLKHALYHEKPWELCGQVVHYTYFMVVSVILELFNPCSYSLEKVIFCAPHKKIKSYGFGTKWGNFIFGMSYSFHLLPRKKEIRGVLKVWVKKFSLLSVSSQGFL